MDLINDPTPGRNTPEYTVSEISGAVKRTLEDEFGRIRVRGEVGRVFRAKSGHLYYDLKDDRNVLACTTWKGQIAGLSVVPEEGLEVIVTGRLTAFGAQSKYNLNVDDVVVAGAGALMAMLEKRRMALEAEGLFAAERKKPLPFLPEVIGVVTSPQGAVIRDILHRLRDRFPRKVLVWPVAVQGAACAPEVAAAIRGFNALTPGGALPRPDLLIVARGGGSVEDLWGFNEEIVVRAAAESRIPLISAVGHETDTTLIDYAADRRAPTPTAAAELAVPVRAELLAWTQGMADRMSRAIASGLARRGEKVRDLARALPRAEALLDGPRQRLDHTSFRLERAPQELVGRARMRLAQAVPHLHPGRLVERLVERRAKFESLSARLDPAARRLIARKRDGLRGLRLPKAPLERRIADGSGQLDRLATRLGLAMQADLARRRDRLAALDRLRETLGHRQTLERGYAIVRGDGKLVTTAAAAAAARRLDIEFADGVVTRGADDLAPPKKPARKAPDGGGDDQGSLF